MINLKTSVKFKMGIATIPSINGHSISQTAGSGFGISKTTKDPPGCLACDHGAHQPGGGAVPRHGRAFPRRVAQQKYWYANAVPGAKQVLSYQQTFVGAIPTTPNWNQVETLSQNYLTTIVNEGGSCAAALATIQQLATSQ